MRNARTHAKWAAKAIISVHFPNREVVVCRICELLDEEEEFRSLAWSSLIGAVREAARELGRYDKKNDEITA